MRILVVTQYFWPENFHINDVVRGLIEKGHEVTVLTGLPNYPQGSFFSGYGMRGPYRQVHDGAEVYRVPLVPRGHGRFELALNYVSFALAASLLAPFLSIRQPDVILIYQASPVTVAIPALLLSRLKRSPAVLWVQDLWPESLVATGAVNSKRILAGVERLVRGIYRGSALILVKSRGFERQIRRIAGSTPIVRYFPDWAGVSTNPANDSGGPMPDVPEGFLVMFAGNIGAAQDFETILAAAELLKDYKGIQWVILGAGSKRTWVEAEVQAAGLHSVHLLGQKPPELMPQYFSRSDALLVTLKDDAAFALTVPGKVRAYLASGKPIVAALPGEGAAVVEEAAAGVVCRPQDPAGLANAVLEVYKMSPDERLAMGARGKAFYDRNYDRNMLLAQLEEWLTEAAKKGLA